jgi:addiction module HigA family antidote
VSETKNPVIRIRELMDEFDYSHRELAKEIGVSPSYISDILNRRRLISIPVAKKLERTLTYSDLGLMKMQLEKQWNDYDAATQGGTAV